MSDDRGDQDVPDFFLDEDFVAGARYTEMSASQRAELAAAEVKAQREAEAARRKAQQREQRSEVWTRRRPLISFGVLILLGVLMWRLTGSDGDGSSAIGPKQVQAYYAIPAGAVAPADPVAAIRNEIGVVQDWLEGETERTLRFVSDGGAVTVSPKRLKVSEARLAEPAGASLVAEAFLDDEGTFPTDTLVLVFVPITLSDPARCPDSSGDGLAIVWTGSCGEAPSAATRRFGEGASFSIAHGLVHALGAVRPCAPHYGNRGHVTDDPADLMYRADDGSTVLREDVILDPDRDDYYETGKKGCDGIDKSRAWNK